MRSTGIFAAFAVLAMVFLLCSCGPDRSNKIVMVTEATFPPYEFREGGGSSELMVDLMQAVAQEIGKELVVEDMSFDSVISAVVTGKGGCRGIRYYCYGGPETAGQFLPPLC